MEGFDANGIKLHIIPLQNPEGFDISTSTLKMICDDNFREKSYEYYLRYIRHVKPDRDDSIYVVTGGICHDII